MSRDPYQILHRAGGGPRHGRLGLLFFVVGLTVLALVARRGLGQGLGGVPGPVLVAIAGALALAGVLLLALTIMRPVDQLGDLEERLRSRPSTIARAWRQIDRPARGGRRRPRPARGLQQAVPQQAVIEADDGTTWVIAGQAGQVSAILQLVASRCPHAELRGL